MTTGEVHLTYSSSSITLPLQTNDLATYQDIHTFKELDSKLNGFKDKLESEIAEWKKLKFVHDKQDFQEDSRVTGNRDPTTVAYLRQRIKHALIELTLHSWKKNPVLVQKTCNTGITNDVTKETKENTTRGEKRQLPTREERKTDPVQGLNFGNTLDRPSDNNVNLSRSFDNHPPEEYDDASVLTIKSLKNTNNSLSATTKPFKVTTSKTKILKTTTKPAVTTKYQIVTTKTQNVARKPDIKTTKPQIVTTIQKVATKHQNIATKPPIMTTKLYTVTTKVTGVPVRLSNVTIKPQVVTKKSHSVTKTRTAPTKPKPVYTTPWPMGDEFGTDDTYLNSTCPNRTRDKLNSQEFKERFLDTIPVFQWKKHAKESEYRRLQRYIGAFGWMGVTWQIVNETLNLMNSSNSGYLFDNWKGDRPCVRCAVLGNGGIMNGSGMGKEIDAHDYVFRVNGAITKGFENDVGNRTSFFFFSTNTMMNSLNAYRKQGFKMLPRSEETRFLILPDHDRDYLLVRAALTNSVIDRGRDKSRNPFDYFGGNLTTEHFRILHPDFMRYLRNRYLWAPILNTKNRNIYRPSTGASMLLTAVHTCDQVNAYGFITPNYANFSDHYFDKTYKKVVFYANHSFRNEMTLWQQLHKAGVINLYMRD
ncbi:alpha-N-acetylgalactosaminide alpha-2,6-sialyltransferase 1-like [Pelodytes ibericus]